MKYQRNPKIVFSILDEDYCLFNPENADRIFDITTTAAIERAKKFIKKTGILIGISSGANILASEQYVNSMNPDGVVITMLCDRGERYMSVYNH